MRVGFFLGYGPQARYGTEGLGRYLGGLIKGFISAGVAVTVAAPVWSRKSLEKLFTELDIPLDAVSFVTNAKSEPFVWKVYKWLVLKERKSRTGLMKKLTKLLGEAAILFTKTSTEGFAKYLPLYILAFLLGLVMFIPALILLLLYVLVSRVLRKARKKTSHLKKKESLKEDDDQSYLEIFHAMTDVVVEQLVRVVNAGDYCDLWFVPSSFWPQVNDIKKPVVINVPDVVTAIYSAEFADQIGARSNTRDVKKTIENGRFFITYSEYIRRSVVIGDFGKDPDCVVAIPHVNNTSRPYIAVDNERAKDLNSPLEYDLELSRKMLRKMFSKSCPAYYAERMNFEDVHYIFYASQIRPHKNIISLLKAYEYLLREKHHTIKLFLTGIINPDEYNTVSAYVFEHGLEHDVLSFSGVPAATLAALYRCADLVVNPSLYEGGFPFTLGEGMSVGTPSLMARSPFDIDVLEGSNLLDITFDPYDWKDLADKIEYWLPRRDELYDKQLAFYKEMEKRTPDVVARDYLEKFEYFIDLYNQGKGL